MGMMTLRRGHVNLGGNLDRDPSPTAPEPASTPHAKAPRSQMHSSKRLRHTCRIEIEDLVSDGTHIQLSRSYLSRRLYFLEN